VRLEIFEGPLDLLLYLIKKNDLDILRIQISQITQEYLAYIELMKELNLEVAGDFLVMAATLIQIKARSLLPAQEGEEGIEGPDPQGELVQKLLEYQKFKEAAGFLQKRSEEFSDVFYRGSPRFEEHEKALNIRIFDLLTTLREILDRAEGDGRVVLGEEHRIEEKMERIVKLLEERPYLSIREVFAGEKRRVAIITCFLALLELIKTQRVIARQEAPLAEIFIYRKDAPPPPAQPLWPTDEEPRPAPPLPPEAPEAKAEEPSAEPPVHVFEPTPEAAAAPPADNAIPETAGDEAAAAATATPPIDEPGEKS
jgi:segregation and condensation protein A